MFCKKCGQKLDEETKACQNCNGNSEQAVETPKEAEAPKAETPKAETPKTEVTQVATGEVSESENTTDFSAIFKNKNAVTAVIGALVLIIFVSMLSSGGDDGVVYFDEDFNVMKINKLKENQTPDEKFEEIVDYYDDQIAQPLATSGNILYTLTAYNHSRDLTLSYLDLNSKKGEIVEIDDFTGSIAGSKTIYSAEKITGGENDIFIYYDNGDDYEIKHYNYKKDQLTDVSDEVSSFYFNKEETAMYFHVYENGEITVYTVGKDLKPVKLIEEATRILHNGVSSNYNNDGNIVYVADDSEVVSYNVSKKQANVLYEVIDGGEVITENFMTEYVEEEILVSEFVEFDIVFDETVEEPKEPNVNDYKIVKMEEDYWTGEQKEVSTTDYTKYNEAYSGYQTAYDEYQKHAKNAQAKEIFEDLTATISYINVYKDGKLFLEKIAKVESTYQDNIIYSAYDKGEKVKASEILESNNITNVGSSSYLNSFERYMVSSVQNQGKTVSFLQTTKSSETNLSIYDDLTSINIVGTLNDTLYLTAIDDKDNKYLYTTSATKSKPELVEATKIDSIYSVSILENPKTKDVFILNQGKLYSEISGKYEEIIDDVSTINIYEDGAVFITNYDSELYKMEKNKEFVRLEKKINQYYYTKDENVIVLKGIDYAGSKVSGGDILLIDSKGNVKEIGGEGLSLIPTNNTQITYTAN